MWDGVSIWQPINASTAYSLWDLDRDTGVQVEEGGPGTDEDIIRFDTDGTQRMVIDSIGGTYIGLYSPAFSQRLSVKDSDNVYGIGSINATNSDPNNYINLSTFSVRNVNNGLHFLVSGTTNQRKTVIQAGHGHPNYASRAGTISLNPFGGRVGIGVLDPLAPLDVNGRVRIRNLPDGAVTDSIVTANVDGDLRKQSITDIVASVSATSFRTVTTNTTLTSTDGTVVVRAVATTAITLTLPLASDLPQGGCLTLKRLDDTATPAAVNIVAGNATNTIDGNTNAAYTTQLATNAAKMTLQSDGVSAWYIISQ